MKYANTAEAATVHSHFAAMTNGSTSSAPMVSGLPATGAMPAQEVEIATNVKSIATHGCHAKHDPEWSGHCIAVADEVVS